MKLTLVFISFLFLSCSYRKDAPGTDPVFPQVLASNSYQNCYNAAGFFRVDKDKINHRIPQGFATRDGGSILRTKYNGHGLLVLIYFSCPASDHSAFQAMIIATPIEEPSLAADLREVRWNWHELARIAGSSGQAEALYRLGFSVESGN